MERIHAYARRDHRQDARIMIRSYEGLERDGTAWRRREVWSTHSMGRASVQRDLHETLMGDGAYAVLLHDEDEYVRFCAERRVG
jgi:hypothetical protein